MKSKLILLLLTFLALLATPLYADGVKLGDQVSGDVQLTADEKAALQPVLAHYYANMGSKPVLQKVIATCVDTGCRGDCISEVLRLVNTEMKEGATNSAAGDKVVDALTAVKQRCVKKNLDASPAEISRAVKNLVEAKYKSKKDAAFFRQMK